MTRYRFRVRGPDGKETLSEVFEAQSAAPAGKLGLPAWSNPEYGHGERTMMKVKGTGLDGRQIRFVIEHKSATGWGPYGESTGVMKNGVATAQFHAHHPHVKGGGKPEEADPADLRFYCEPV